MRHKQRTAPKYKGISKVNPIATVLSRAWMLEYLGEKDIAKAIFDATEQVVNEGKYFTYDLGGNASTSSKTEQIAIRAAKTLR